MGRKFDRSSTPPHYPVTECDTNPSTRCNSHSGIRINILKAMTIINWLDSLDTSAWNNITVNDDVLADQHPLAR